MNMFDLTGKIALVTGGAHSIGFAIGRGLALAGAKVCFNCTSENSRVRGEAN
jgi:gluconate 5-dehydrogenase